MDIIKQYVNSSRLRRQDNAKGEDLIYIAQELIRIHDEIEALMHKIDSSGVQSVSDDGSGVVTVDNTSPQNPVVGFAGVNTDGVTIIGDGSSANPLQASGIGSPLTTKGDLLTHDGSNVAVLAVGSNGRIFVADSAEPTGQKWEDPSAVSTTPLPHADSHVNGTDDIQIADATQKGLLSAADWNTFNSKQDALGYTPEDVANKQNNLSPSAVKYPTVDAVNAGLAGKQDALGYTPPPDTRQINTSAPLTGGGDLTADRTLGITQANGSTDGYLSATDWNTFNNKQNALGFTPVPETRAINTNAPLTGGGNLTADRTISIPQANNTTDGYLSSADWNTFNNKQNALGFTPVPETRQINTTAPLTGGGDLTANRTLGITQASGTTNGYLSSTDWNTFNSKLSDTDAAVGSRINSAGAATPNDSDFVATAENAGLLKKITWTNVKAFLKTYFDTIYHPKPTGTPDGTKYLRDDNTWQPVSSGGLSHQQVLARTLGA